MSNLFNQLHQADSLADQQNLTRIGMKDLGTVRTMLNGGEFDEKAYNAALAQWDKDYFNKLPSSAQASLTSLTYNYGSLDKLPSVVKAARSGNLMELSRAIENLGSHNKGVNRNRRLQEAQYFLSNR